MKKVGLLIPFRSAIVIIPAFISPFRLLTGTVIARSRFHPYSTTL
ncbi:hypothetical protein ACQVWM_05200 [Bacillus pretiosus]